MNSVTTIYSASWVVPIASDLIEDGAVAVEGARIVGVGPEAVIKDRFPESQQRRFSQAAIIPGLINTHTHLELTAMRGYLENEESNFFAWLRKLTIARLERMSSDDILVSATLGACEALRAGITCVADASDSAAMSMTALKDTGLRGVVFQESFGPDARFATENFEKLRSKVAELKSLESECVKVGVSPHAPYTVCGAQLELISEFAQAEKLPVMMHAAESASEDALIRDGCGMFADGLARRGIEWNTAGSSPIRHLKEKRILETRPLLAHCIRVDESDIELLFETRSKVAHCPKSNAKLGHGRAPFAKFLQKGIVVGLGSDSVASNNTCDILEESRYAALVARSDAWISASEVLRVATSGGARCLELEGVVGELREGVQADLAVISLNGRHQVPVYDPAVATVFSSSGRDTLLTVVAGKELYREGRVVNADEERLAARMTEISKKLQA
jgi:cytosine/adenosine deaminase-related metal-dependent hydrolase